MLLTILIAVILVSLISLVGIFIIGLSDEFLSKILLTLVAFAAGTLLGSAFLHLLPESLENGSPSDAFGFVILGIMSFYFLERFLFWRHCHKDECEVHSFTYMNLIGDGLHNFIDGMIIATSFMVNLQLGIATTMAIITHEIPQEIGDFGILVYGGISKRKAISYNLISALAAIVGAGLGYFLSVQIGDFSTILLPYAAGGFIYIATADLVPELHKETNFQKALLQFLLLIIGIGIMWALQ